MTCEECEQILLDSSNCFSYKGWMPGVSVLNLAKSHAQGCSACAAKVPEIAEVNDALDQLRFSTMHMEAPAAVEMNLLAGFRRRINIRTPSVATTFPWRVVWGSAAALLLVAGIMLYSMLRPGSPTTVRIERKDHQHLPQEELAVLSRGTAGRAVIVNHSSSADLTGAASPKGDGAKLAKPIHEQMRRRSPLPIGDQLSLNGGSNVVRVTLPVSSLVAMGVPVYPDASDRRVTADVMMDPFGAVVAIHLVEVKPSVN